MTSGDWYAIYHHLPVVKGVSFKPLLLINQWEKDKKNQPKNPSNSSRIDGAFLVMGLLELDSTWRCRLGPVAYCLGEKIRDKNPSGEFTREKSWQTHRKTMGKSIGKYMEKMGKTWESWEDMGVSIVMGVPQ